MAALPRDSTALLATKVSVVGATLFVAGSMSATSMQFVPALIQAARSVPSTKKPETSGRLTPQPGESKQLSIDQNQPSNSFDGYRAAAKQFVVMSKTAFATQVPVELLSIVASGYLAYRSYSKGLSNVGHKWAAVATLVAAMFPLTGGFMVPIDHKIARLGGEEEKLEPYEDMPPDRDAERRNTVDFLGRWDTLNRVRSVIMFSAGAIGLWGLVE